MKKRNKLIDTLCSTPYKQALVSMWVGLALLAVIFVQGYLGWLLMGAWLILTSVISLYVDKKTSYRRQNIERSDNIAEKLWAHGIFRFAFFYSALYIPFVVTLEPHEIVWWMYFSWLVIAALATFYTKVKGQSPPFKEPSNEN